MFTSSLAVFGGPLPDPVPDDAPVTPQASYGAQKAIGEFLVYDMTRKGFIDGRSLRLPTVTVRPGKPNKAASSFASGIIREPLAGVDAPCPGRTDHADVGAVAARGHRQSDHRPRGAGVRVHAHALDQRARNLGGGRATWSTRCARWPAMRWPSRVQWNYDPAIDRIVSTWPANFAPVLGPALGMRADDDFESIVRAYIADDMPRP